jgi:hypothetical protein
MSPATEQAGSGMTHLVYSGEILNWSLNVLSEDYSGLPQSPQYNAEIIPPFLSLPLL